ncbi:MAG: hypothetical protein R3327_06520, partial [Nitrosopumilaceae archaeon]|nr:hypothetical protein [Nitrosopumilaceae archaeon]
MKKKDKLSKKLLLGRYDDHSFQTPDKITSEIHRGNLQEQLGVDLPENEATKNPMRNSHILVNMTDPLTEEDHKKVKKVELLKRHIPDREERGDRFIGQGEKPRREDKVIRQKLVHEDTYANPTDKLEDLIEIATDGDDDDVNFFGGSYLFPKEMTIDKIGVIEIEPSDITFLKNLQIRYHLDNINEFITAQKFDNTAGRFKMNINNRNDIAEQQHFVDITKEYHQDIKKAIRSLQKIFKTLAMIEIRGVQNETELRLLYTLIRGEIRITEASNYRLLIQRYPQIVRMLGGQEAFQRINTRRLLGNLFEVGNQERIDTKSFSRSEFFRQLEF